VVSAVALALVAASGVWAFSDLTLRTDPTEFVPESDDAELAAIAREVTDSELARTTIVSIGPTDDAHLAASLARSVGDALRANDAIAWVRTGPPEDAQSAFYELYFPRRLSFVAASVDEARAITTDEGLEARVRDLRAQLGGPTAMLVRRIAPEDPLLAFPSIFRAFQGDPSDAADSGSALDVVDGAFVATEGDAHYGIVMLASRGTTFRAEAQEPILAAIDQAFTRARDEAGAPAARVVLEQAGVARVLHRIGCWGGSARFSKADFGAEMWLFERSAGTYCLR